MSLTEKELKDLHKRSYHNRGAIEASQQCGCFHCLRTFEPQQIQDWIDGEKTASCPHCCVDSVLPGQPSDETLRAMRERWFEQEADVEASNGFIQADLDTLGSDLEQYQAERQDPDPYLEGGLRHEEKLDEDRNIRETED